MTKYLQHGRVRLALHQLKQSSHLNPTHPLLLLHGLGECSDAHHPLSYQYWPGHVYALDFTGHGKSSIPMGGGYSCETLMADVDIALAHIGPATVCGRGLGAYVTLLIAGGRPDFVLGAILLDGPGLAGTCPSSSPYIPPVETHLVAPPDPFAIAELSTDARPAEYAAHFALLASQNSPLPHPIAVLTREQPPWISAVRNLLNCEFPSLIEASQQFAQFTVTSNVPHQ